MVARSERFVVFGQVGQDLALRLDDTPTPGSSSSATAARWLLGGKGANQAVGLTQLGARVALVGVVGDGDRGAALRQALIDDGIDVCCVAQRGPTTVLVDAVDQDAERLLLEYIPEPSLLTHDDVDGAEWHVRHAGTACLQGQQPGDVLVAAARMARRYGTTVALDGAPDAASADELISLADVIRADAVEAADLVGFEIATREDAERAGAELLGRGASTVALEVPREGDLVSWPDGARFLPYGDQPVVDRTGAGDAFFAALTRALAAGRSVESAAGLASAASASTVGRLGGRPSLDALRVE